MNIFRALVHRLQEPSTHAGLAGLAVLAGATFDQVQLVANGLGAALGVVAVLLPERGGS